MEVKVIMFNNKDKVYCNEYGFGTFISYDINNNDAAIVKFDQKNSSENEFGYNLVPSVLLKAEEEVYVQYRLTSIIQATSGEKVEIKGMTGKWFTFQRKSLQIGMNLTFRVVDEIFGFKNVGEILSIEDKVVRKRDYKIIKTHDREYHLLKK